MDIKEAKEIVAHPENYSDNPILHQKFDNAKGYLKGYAAHKQKARVLVEMLNYINNWHKKHLPLSHIKMKIEETLNDYQSDGEN